MNINSNKRIDILSSNSKQSTAAHLIEKHEEDFDQGLQELITKLQSKF